jgi:hypothetical protein
MTLFLSTAEKYLSLTGLGRENMNTRIIKIDGLQVDASETETEKN